MAESMDLAWAKEVLDWWQRNATSALIRSSNSGVSKKEVFARNGPKIDLLRTREHQTREVLARVLGLDRLPSIIDAFSRDAVELAHGIELVKYALGVISTQAETAAHLGSPAPKMVADQMHPTVWKAAERLWKDGHFGQAVQRAATFLNAEVQDSVGRHDISDAALMQQVFSSGPPEPDKPRLRWPGEDDNLTVKAMRSGILNFSQGCFMAIRNRVTHSRDDLPEQVALEHLATLSTLARWIDACSIVRVDAE